MNPRDTFESYADFDLDGFMTDMSPNMGLEAVMKVIKLAEVLARDEEESKVKAQTVTPDASVPRIERAVKWH